ncbi:hypothetical protein R5O87_18940 [Arthrobacter globiformis]
MIEGISGGSVRRQPQRVVEELGEADPRRRLHRNAGIRLGDDEVVSGGLQCGQCLLGLALMELDGQLGMPVPEVLDHLGDQGHGGRLEGGDFEAQRARHTAHEAPRISSVVPDLAEITVDLRNPDNALMAEAEADLEAFLAGLPQAQPGLRVETKRMAKTNAVPFSEEIQSAIASAAGELGHENHEAHVRGRA